MTDAHMYAGIAAVGSGLTLATVVTVITVTARAALGVAHYRGSRKLNRATAVEPG